MAAITSTPLVSPEQYVARYVEGGEKPACEYIEGKLRRRETSPETDGNKRT
jgi:hypothetical protein